MRGRENPRVSGKRQRGGEFIAVDVKRAAALLPSMNGFTSATLDRRKLVMRYYSRIRELDSRPAVFVSCMYREFKNSTAVTYCNVLEAMYGELKRDAEWISTFRWLRKQKMNLVQAVPATLVDMCNIILFVTDTKIKTLLLVLFFSLSRYSDVLDTVIDKTWEVATPTSNTVLQLNPGRFKSDIFGEKSLYKMFEMPVENWFTAEDVKQMLLNPPSYNEVYMFLKNTPMFSHLTLHSFRRGGISACSHFFDRDEIIKLTLHAVPNDNNSVRRYIEPHVSSKEAVLQREMVRYLQEAVRTTLAQRRG